MSHYIDVYTYIHILYCVRRRRRADDDALTAIVIDACFENCAGNDVGIHPRTFSTDAALRLRGMMFALSVGKCVAINYF